MLNEPRIRRIFAKCRARCHPVPVRLLRWFDVGEIVIDTDCPMEPSSGILIVRRVQSEGTGLFGAIGGSILNFQPTPAGPGAVGL